MKHRCKEEEVLTTDEDDFDVRVPGEGLFQTQRCMDAGKATTQDDDPLWPVRGAFRAVPEEKHGNLLCDHEPVLASVLVLRSAGSAQRRNPPRNALALSPARQPG